MVTDRFLIISLSCAGNIVFGNHAVRLFILVFLWLARLWLGYSAERTDKLKMIAKEELINDL